MKRLLCIVASLDQGGAETFLMKLYRRLDTAAYQMDFIVCADGAYDEEVLSRGGRIVKIPLRTHSPGKAMQAITKAVREGRYAYVIKLCDSPVGVLDLIAAKRGGAEWIGARSCNSFSSESALRHFAGEILRPVLNRVCDYRLAPSDLAAKYTFGEKAYQNGEVCILKNALDLDTYRFDPTARTAIRAELGISDKTPVIGHIGRFSAQKNHSFLLDVFASIKARQPEAVLLLVGKGELETEIRDRAAALRLSDSVIFTGVRSDVPALLSAMDVFVFPSLYEGMPNTVIEAQATGLPCVIADTVTREADITGLVQYLPLENPERWAAEALSSIPEDRADTHGSFIGQGYEIESVVGQFIKLVFKEQDYA